MNPRGSRRGTMTEMSDLTVREMRLAEVGMRIDYFHDSSDEHLRAIGVDRRLLPERDAWFSIYEEDDTRPIHERVNYAVVWELDGDPVGFSSTDRIAFGEQAFMHLHLVDSSRRRSGLGTEFVMLTVQHYFRVLELERVFCEPNAFNAAPHRALQRAGFQFIRADECIPGPLNFPQVTIRWVMDRRRVEATTSRDRSRLAE